MAHKMHPTAMRLGTNKSWKSLWFSEGDDYEDQLHEDIMIRDFLNKELKIAGLDRVEISRSLKRIEVTVYVARPGVAIGRGGESIDAVNKELSRRIDMPIEVRIKEVDKPDLSAEILANEVATSMEHGQSPTRAMLAVRDKAMQAGAKGVTIWVSGDFGVPKQSRTIKIDEGHVPLQTIRADVDFAREAVTIRNEGLRGVKVWVFKGEILDNEMNDQNENNSNDNSRRNKDKSRRNR
jgi:small subunit ribosomal protein S3